MSRKQKAIRLIISGTLLAAVALVGATVYRVETNQLEDQKLGDQVAEAPEKPTKEEPEISQEETKDESEVENHAAVIEEEEEVPEAEDATSSDVSAQVEAPVEESTADVATPVLPELNFTEDSLMQWPIAGNVVLDYSMDHTIYFPTLDVYKYNPSVLVGANSGDPVVAAANCKIISIEENTETGTSVITDMGNGYQAVYGQLKDVTVAAEDVVSVGTILGYVNEPTRFYTAEGTNLYFSMTKDGESIDPIVYLP